MAARVAFAVATYKQTDYNDKITIGGLSAYKIENSENGKGACVALLLQISVLCNNQAKH